MKSISLSEAEVNFNTIIGDIVSGNELAITHGTNKDVIAVIVPFETWRRTKKRQLGSLRNRGKVIFEKDFYMSEEEFIDL
jgi:PHD/YefM family antitoxin component YafN of YafNO toxin-antitoxin module